MNRTMPSSFLQSPKAATVKGAPASVWHSPSAAAILPGWYSATSWPCMWPVPAVTRPAATMVTAPKRATRRHSSRASKSCLAWAALTIHHTDTPMTTAAATSRAEEMTCSTVAHTSSLDRSLRKPLTPSSSARPVLGLTTAPTGCCIQELAVRMKKAEKFVPAATAHMHRLCSLGDRRSHPKIHRPRKTDSMKKASRASKARGAPKMLPTNLEYSDQFMPNWNS